MVTPSRCPFISFPPQYHFDEVDGKYSDIKSHRPLDTSLGPLSAFIGSYVGTGFNAIFRPNNTVTPTTFTNPIIAVSGIGSHTNDNVLELNVTKEALTFTQQNIGNVPNRGEGSQGDIFLAGVAYMQVVSDMLNQATGKADIPDPEVIHLEPGLWMQVPANQQTTKPTIVRMGSIPHGTSINASGTSPQGGPKEGAPDFSPATLIPNAELGGAIQAFENFSLDVNNANSPRIPQDLTKFVQTNTITQAMLKNPVVVLQSANQGKNIIDHSTIKVDAADPPSDGSGIISIPFLEGTTAVQNAAVTSFKNIFWIETVQYEIEIPTCKAGAQIPVTPTGSSLVSPAPTFLVEPPTDIIQPTTITVTSTQIQYFQEVKLFFAGVQWPHISVGTLVPEAPIVVPASAF